MKTNANAVILRLFDRLGIHIDASSGFEVERAIRAGIKPNNILLTTQEAPSNLKESVEQGIQFNACSLLQLETYGKLFPNSEISLQQIPTLALGLIIG